MDIMKVKFDHMNLFAHLPYTLSLVSYLEVKAPKLCPECFDNVYFTKFIQNEFGKTFWNPVETVSSVGTGKQLYILLRLAIYHLSLFKLFRFIHCLLLCIVILESTPSC